MALKKKTAAAKPVVKEEATEYKYGVGELAEALGIEPASVRVKLRSQGIDKAGRSYGWNTQAEFKEVVAALKSAPAPKKASPAAIPAKVSKKQAEPAPAPKKTKSASRKRASAEATA